MNSRFLVLTAVLPLLLIGAVRAEHWAYVAPQRPPLPTVRDRDWPRNEIDYFVLARRERNGETTPKRGLSRERLLRRVTLDLTGLPPTPEELDAFLADPSPVAYERVVDRLLHSPRYAERMTLDWLDAARYGDTHGYHIDAHRDMWRWRDWVLESFLRNQPFDRFTIEQLAGDLLPQPTVEQLIATGFHRNSMIQSEDGTIEEEYLLEYAADRVVTTGTVWLGQSFQCARCHEHKHDPFTQRDFYRLLAYFNNVPENGVDGRNGNAEPFLPAPTNEQRRRLDHLAQEISTLERSLADRAGQAGPDQARWEQAQSRPANFPGSADLLAYFPLDELGGLKATDLRNGRTAHVHTNMPAATLWTPGKFARGLLCDGETYVEDAGLASWERAASLTLAAWVFPTTDDTQTVLERGGLRVSLHEGRLQLEIGATIRVRAREAIPTRQWTHVAVTYDGSPRAAGCELFTDGQRAAKQTLSDRRATATHTAGPLVIGRSFRGMLDEVRIYGRSLLPPQVAALAAGSPIEEILLTPSGKRSPQQTAMLTRHFLELHDDVYRQLSTRLASVKRQQAELERQVPTTMVMRERPTPRETFVLARGDYRFRQERVTPGVPSALRGAGFPPDRPADDSIPTRLDLAKWLVDPANPLTARVIVNRYWQSYFGEGLVATPDDFGTRGKPPSNPELLDWLATEFIRTGWDVKQMQRLIVTSATYRDLAPRRRLPAEFLRDQALFVAGLLDERFGGRSVFPYQPPGLWEELSFDPTEYTAQVYTPSRGADLYRRGMYSFWKRASPPAGLAILDAPDREVCTVRRASSNTPLQSLVLFNDPTFVEAARSLAERVLTQGGRELDERLRNGFRWVTSRGPTAEELSLLRNELRQQLAEFRADPAAAGKLLGVGESRRNAKLDPVEHAAYTAIANLLLNLDETLNRP